MLRCAVLRCTVLCCPACCWTRAGLLGQQLRLDGVDRWEGRGASTCAQVAIATCCPRGLSPRCAQGMGDCLLTYENEAFFTNLVVPEKERLPYIVPDNNIRVGSATDLALGLVG